MDTTAPRAGAAKAAANIPEFAVSEIAGAIRRIDLGEVIWPRDKPVHTLRRALFCEPCRAATAVNFRPDGGRKFRPALIALLMPEPHAQPPVAARAARR